MRSQPTRITAGPIPKYRQLLLILRDQILSGEVGPNERLPSEEVLCRNYNLSRGTIRKAIAQLEAEGLIETEHGIGSFVRAAHPNAIPFHFAISSQLKGTGDVTVEVLAQEIILAPIEITERLHLPLGSTVVHIARRQRLNDNVISYSERYLAKEIMPSLIDTDLTKVPSIHDLLVSESEFPLLRADVAIEAHYMSEEEAQLLQTEVGESVIVINRTTYTAPNRPAVLYRGLYKDEYNLTIRIGDVTT